MEKDGDGTNRRRRGMNGTDSGEEMNQEEWGKRRGVGGNGTATRKRLWEEQEEKREG